MISSHFQHVKTLELLVAIQFLNVQLEKDELEEYENESFNVLVRRLTENDVFQIQQTMNKIEVTKRGAANKILDIILFNRQLA